MKLSIFVLFTLIISLFNSPLLAKSVVTSAAPKVKIIHYDPEQVTTLNAYFGYQMDIVFSPEETVQQVVLGDASVWSVAYINNHVFIKPKALSMTNMAVITSAHDYTFQLITRNDRPTKIIYQLRFVYPASPVAQTIKDIAKASHQDPQHFNWQYSYTGDASQVPAEMFDDNQFTYMKFKQEGMSNLPAIFQVDKDRNETLVNYHQEGDYIVIHRIVNQFTLRHGNAVTSLYNDKAIEDWKKHH